MTNDAATQLQIGCTSLRLPADMGIRRQMRHPARERPAAFSAAFDALQLIYDVFWHEDHKRIVIAGPPPLNLARLWKKARITALPSGERLGFQSHKSLSTMQVETTPAPENTDRIALEFAGRVFELAVQPNFVEKTAGSRVLFTMSKNNDLDWIRYWADWHVRLHGTDTVFLFDNGSDRYDVGEIEAALGAVDGLKTVGVIDFPYLFGAFDPAVKVNPYWAHFAQISSMSIVLRRLAGQARGLLNCDIDELANAPGGRSLYDIVAETRAGLLILPGRWVEPDTGSSGQTSASSDAHERFSLVDRDKNLSDSSPVKWILDPRRVWTKSLAVHPYWHWIHKRPPFTKTFLKGAFFWHFRGINTGWKDERRLSSRTNDLVVDEELVSARTRFDDASIRGLKTDAG